MTAGPAAANKVSGREAERIPAGAVGDAHLGFGQIVDRQRHRAFVVPTPSPPGQAAPPASTECRGRYHAEHGASFGDAKFDVIVVRSKVWNGLTSAQQDTLRSAGVKAGQDALAARDTEAVASTAGAVRLYTPEASLPPLNRCSNCTTHCNR